MFCSILQAETSGIKVATEHFHFLCTDYIIEISRGDQMIQQESISYLSVNIVYLDNKHIQNTTRITAAEV